MNKWHLQLGYIGFICLSFIVVIIFVGVLAPYLAPHDPTMVSVINKFQPPSKDYLLGTDQLGRCLLSRLIFGIRTTVFIAILAMIITLFIGCLVGFFAGYFGGKVDSFLMRIVDIVLSFPSDIMIITIIGIVGPSLLNIILSIVVIKWAWYARIFRAVIKHHKNQNYIYFAKIHNASCFYILHKHLLPSIAVEVLALATMNIGGVILMISALSFLGFGIQAPTAEWGSMLSEAKNFIVTRPYLMLPSGLAITFVVIAFNYLGDILQDRRQIMVFTRQNRQGLSRL